MASSSADRGPRPGKGDPAGDASDLAALVRELWGIEGRIEPLPGYQDRNALLTTSEGRRFVVKLVAPGDDRPLLEAQHRVLRRLAGAGSAFRFPVPVPSRTGEDLVEVPGAGGPPGEPRLLRVLSHVPGVPLARVHPRLPRQLEEVGRLLGTVDRALDGVDEPAAHRAMAWEARRGREVVAHGLEEEADAGRAGLLARVLELHDRRVAPGAARLRTGLIHGDGHDDNVLVEPVGEDLLAPRRVTGLIDFGDLVHSWVVAEPAVAAAYLMMGRADPLAAAERVVAGYHAVHPLTPEELDALFPLACLRLAMSVTLAARRRREGRTEPYLFVSEGPAWDLLARLLDVSPDLARYGLRDACGLPACPATREVVGWLREHSDDVGPVLEPDPRTAARHTFDLSVGSTEVGGLDGLDGADAWTRALFRRMEEVGSAVGVGLWNEARRWYAAEAYREDTDEGPRWRTVHLGVDLFVPPRTPVRAPLSGTVHSVRDNRGPLDYGPTVVLRHETGGGTPFHTLYGHLDRESLEGKEPGAPVARGEVLGRVGAPPDNGGWAPHLHLQLVVDMMGREGEFPGVARPDRRALWTSLSPDPNLLLRLPEGCQAPDPPSTRALAEERRRLLGPNLSLSYRDPLHIVRGRGAHLYDAVGRRYVDCVNNVAHVGHAHPRVVEALGRQAAVLNTNTRYLHRTILAYVRRLTSLLPEPLRVGWLVCSGSEANELALRLARAHTGRRTVLVQEGAYHGNTTSLVDVSPYKFDGPGGGGRPPRVRVVAMPDPYRGRHRGADAGPAYATEVARALREAEGEGDPVGAFLAEPLLGCGGQVVPPPEYLPEAFRHVREAGGVCIADEVQVGFGRVGTHWWGFEALDAVPDIVTLGKPMGNGHPLGAVVTTSEIARSFDTGMEYFNTFGGNPVSCAVGLAVLDVIREEGLRERARDVGTRLKEGLEELRTRHPLVGDVRGLGLFLGVELVLDRELRMPAPRQARYVVERARDLGVLLSTDGPDQDVLKIKPPMVFDEGDADRLLETLDRVLGEDPARPGSPSPPERGRP